MTRLANGAPHKQYSPFWYLKQAQNARATAARKRGRLRAALLTVADRLEDLARIAEEVLRITGGKDPDA